MSIRDTFQPRVIEDNHRLLRRVLNPNQIEWHEDGHRWVPSLAAMRFDDDLSMFVREILEEQGHGLKEVSARNTTATVEHHPVYEISAGEVRAREAVVEHTPNADTEIGYGHASVYRPSLEDPVFRTWRTLLAVAMSCVHRESELPPPPPQQREAS